MTCFCVGMLQAADTHLSANWCLHASCGPLFCALCNTILFVLEALHMIYDIADRREGVNAGMSMQDFLEQCPDLC